MVLASRVNPRGALPSAGRHELIAAGNGAQSAASASASPCGARPLRRAAQHINHRDDDIVYVLPQNAHVPRGPNRFNTPKGRLF